MQTCITVIIPSIGRPTLQNTLMSLQNQSSGNWLALVGFDGVNPPQPVQDNRITYVYLQKLGQPPNFAGEVRNALIPLVITDWLCFLDDDDTFRPHYMDAFMQELNSNPDADCIVFRMSLDPQNTRILPPLNSDKIVGCQVGISFAVKKEFLQNNGIQFVKSCLEDFEFLETIKDAKGKIVVSKQITYNVRY